jgi:hypothetical protein
VDPDPATTRPAPDSPAAPAQQPEQSSPSLQLHYATPKPRGRFTSGGPDDPILRALRQVVFAIGAGLMVFGITSAIAHDGNRDAAYYAGWGAGFVALATPLWRVRKDEP